MDVRVRTSERIVHLGSDLVAADARAGTDHRRDRQLVGAERSQRAHALLEHAGGEAAPAGVEHRDGAVAAERDGQAVGGEHHRPHAGRCRGMTVRVDRYGLPRCAG